MDHRRRARRRRRGARPSDVVTGSAGPRFVGWGTGGRVVSEPLRPAPARQPPALPRPPDRRRRRRRCSCVGSGRRRGARRRWSAAAASPWPSGERRRTTARVVAVRRRRRPTHRRDERDGHRRRRGADRAADDAADDGRRPPPPSARRARPRCSSSATATPATFGPYLKELLDAHRRRRDDGRLQGVVGAGPARLLRLAGAPAAELPAADPDIVVVTFGGNDAQGLANADGSFLNGRPGRRRGRVAARVHPPGRRGDGPARRRRAHRVWVGIPNDDSPEVTARLAVQDEAVRAALADPPRRRSSSTRGPGSPAATAAGPSTSSTPATASARTSAPTTASTSTRTAPRSSPSTSPRSSPPTSAPAAPTSDALVRRIGSPRRKVRTEAVSGASRRRGGGRSSSARRRPGRRVTSSHVYSKTCPADVLQLVAALGVPGPLGR